MKVSIDAGGREVEIECSDANVSVSAVATEALMLWRATEGATLPAAGPAFGLGLAAVDLATDRTPTTTMRQHPGVAE